MPITVAIVEDDAEIREMLTRAVKRARKLSFLKSFSNGESALAELPALAPNVVIMDIQLPRMNGIECTRAVKQLLPSSQVLVVTVFMDSEQILKALQAGASGYLLKRTSRDEIVEAIEQVWTGGAPMSSQIARKVVESFRKMNLAPTPAPAPSQGSDDAKLTAREEEVLSLLANGQGTKEIADRLSISFDTVRFHLKRIYEKLHVRSRTEAVIKYLK
jgi:DNA-binding NarL/FixJ family response regulator